LINVVSFDEWGLGIGDWGLGIGGWAQSPITNECLIELKIIINDLKKIVKK